MIEKPKNLSVRELVSKLYGLVNECGGSRNQTNTSMILVNEMLAKLDIADESEKFRYKVLGLMMNSLMDDKLSAFYVAVNVYEKAGSVDVGDLVTDEMLKILDGNGGLGGSILRPNFKK